jgi:caa(3)-type oxidase subunit IV
MSDQDHAPNIKLYMIIFGSLLVLTVVTVLISYWHLPPAAAIAVGLAVAGLKAGLVIRYFMHLKGEHALIFYCLGVMLFCMIGFFLIPIDFHLLNDVNTRTAVVAGHHGEEHAPAEHAAPAEHHEEKKPEPAKKPAKKAKAH